MEKHQRLKKFIESKKINQKEFADLIDSTQQYVSALLNGKRKLGTNLVERFESQFPELNIHWLLTGEGKMLKGDESDPEERKYEAEEDQQNYPDLDLFTVRNEIRGDLKVILDGMKKNFETISEGVFYGLREQQKILGFIEKLDAEEISTASRKLNEFLKQNKVTK